jgi:phosphomannomutase
MAPLMISVAGVRGIVGESLTPPVLARFAAAFGRLAPAGPIVVGRDARPSGPMVLRAVEAGLMAAGRDVVDIGLATTPATQVAVERLEAGGGVILTASHNPAPWNALKFLSARGEFLDAATGGAVRARFESDADLWVPFERLGAGREDSRALDWHLDLVLALPFIDAGAIRRRALRVAVDGCASVGGVAVPALLERLGASVIRIDCEPNGRFTRELEPLPEHLGALGEAVREGGADFGVAVDPDADRAALVDARGRPLGEEYTLALGTHAVLERRAGPVVTNLSTSLMIDAVCGRFGVALHRTPVGEAHVVGRMHAVGAVAGGEGNGGMIVPAAHFGRDGLVAVALVAQRMAATGQSLRALADELPTYAMVKEKVARPDTDWDDIARQLKRAFADHAEDSSDGLRFHRDDEWIHVRPSGTEPVVRLIAESPAAQQTRALLDRARSALAAADLGGS